MTQLLAWKAAPKRKPLILKGVRQAGKTTLLEQFGQASFPNYHIINFEKQSTAHQLFEGDLEPSEIIKELQFYVNAPIDINHDLVIFDEIQACPRAITSLKYFCEDMPELALCSAGSLLGLHLNESSYPVGKVDMLHLYPMSFSEFLAGINDDMASDYLAQIKLDSKVSKIAHQRLWNRLKEYFITGGLPENVVIYTELQKNLYQATKAVRQKQNELIKAYYADMAKHSGKVNAMHLDRTWRAVPLQLANVLDSSTNRFKFKGIIPNVNRYKELVNVLDWLEAAELIIKIPIVNTVREPLRAFSKDNMFKIMMFDVGILGAMSGLDPKLILDYDYGTYKGYFAENYVAQQLTASNQEDIFSWHENRSEVEFLISSEGEIYPVEVKSGSITQAKSLQKYREKYQPNKSFIISAKHPSVDAKSNLYNIPLYLVERFIELSKIK